MRSGRRRVASTFVTSLNNVDGEEVVGVHEGRVGEVVDEVVGIVVDEVEKGVLQMGREEELIVVNVVVVEVMVVPRLHPLLLQVHDIHVASICHSLVDWKEMCVFVLLGGSGDSRLHMMAFFPLLFLCLFFHMGVCF